MRGADCPEGASGLFRQRPEGIVADATEGGQVAGLTPPPVLARRVCQSGLLGGVADKANSARSIWYICSLSHLTIARWIVCIGKRKINRSRVFSGQILGIKEVDDKIWLVSFLDYDPGFFDAEEGRVEPGPNPFTPEKL